MPASTLDPLIEKASPRTAGIGAAVGVQEDQVTYQLTVLYHHPQDVDAFDRYYEETHAPLAASCPDYAATPSADPSRTLTGSGRPAT